MNNKEVAKLATKALLYEVSISPKAGLVSRLSNGSHKDMNFYTFIDSALSLDEYFSECFVYGQENDFYSPNFFKNLCPISFFMMSSLLIRFYNNIVSYFKT